MGTDLLVCPTCKERPRKGRRSYCSPCESVRAKEYYSRNRETIRAQQNETQRPLNRARGLMRNYGITPEQYAEMLEKQDGVCAICRQPEHRGRNGRLFDLSVDHNHDTGVVRGLLCLDCNRGLGCFTDDVDRLRAALNYLEAGRGD